MSNATDRWAAGASYEDFMGRWSRSLAEAFVRWLAPAPQLHWLDVGCGTGALGDAVCRLADPRSVHGSDPAAPFITYATEQTQDPRRSFAVAGVGALPPRPGGYGAVASLLALNFFPDPGAAIREMATLAAPGATISAAVWDYAGEMEFLRRFWDAAVALDPAAAALDEGPRFPLCARDPLVRLFTAGGLTEVRCEPVTIPTVFPSFEDYWRPFLGGTGPAPTYVAGLDDRRRASLAERVARSLPTDASGAIPLRASAWAVRGTVS